MKPSLKIILSVFLFCCLIPQATPVYALEQNEIYYRINSNDCWLYRTADIDDNLKYFLLPQSYFVKAINNIDEQIMQVEYDNLIGYVLTSNLTRVYETPQTPYPQKNYFDANNVANAIIYFEPNTQSEYLGIIPFDTTNIKYYGFTFGNEAIKGLGNKWYYCTYQSSAQGKVSGYVYSALITNITQSDTNTEELSIEPVETVSTNEILAPELQDSKNILILFAIGIPAIILLYLIFKPAKVHKITTSQHPKRINYIEQHKDQELDF